MVFSADIMTVQGDICLIIDRVSLKREKGNSSSHKPILIVQQPQSTFNAAGTSCELVIMTK